ncbi:MAG: type II toxin-antitoxin system VapC family toxin [Ilumatobacter sp.]|nr:MAG: type II toxin-antitoxin system VapC family toxin [Ilumatobacter sp.]
MAVTVLLDTHTVLWALMEPARLSTPVRDVLSDRTSNVLVSAASAWEIATKHRLGKLPEADEVVVGFIDHLRMFGAEELAITSAHALAAGRFRIDHRDPFDRMLAAQSMIMGVALVTSDPVFGRFPCGTFW